MKFHYRNSSSGHFALFLQSTLFLVCHFPKSFHTFAVMGSNLILGTTYPPKLLCIKNLKMFSKLSTNHGMKIIIHGRSEIKFYIYGHFRAQKSRKWKWYDTMVLIEFFFYSFCYFLKRTHYNIYNYMISKMSHFKRFYMPIFCPLTPHHFFST